MNWDLFKYPQLLGFRGKEEIKQGKIYFVCLQKQLLNKVEKNIVIFQFLTD